jgi:hypothetical protein
MNPFDNLAEVKIQEAIARGELDALPGFGKPLTLDDDGEVPEDLRAAYHLLRNAGYLPEELTLRQRLTTLERLVAACTEDSAREALSAELRAARVKYEIWIEGRTRRQLPSQYREPALARLAAARFRSGT